MAANLKAEQRQQLEEDAWRLRVKGWLISRIAEHLGVDKSTISRALDRVEKRLAKEFAAQAEVIKARQTAQLEHIHAAAMEQWERSTEDAELTRTVTKTLAKTTSDYDPANDEPLEKEVVEETVTSERRGQSGNPALLAQAREALADIRAIWGLDAPKKADITSGGEPFKVYLFDPDQDEDACPPTPDPET